MALEAEELAAVVAGSIAGLVAFLAVIAIILYFCVRRRRKSRHGNQKHFQHHHLTPDTSLSKNSGPKHGAEIRAAAADPRYDPRMDPRLDPRLPKVGSNSLWFGSPSLYSAAPSQAYQDMKRKGGNPRPSQDPPQGLPAPPGHLVYQSGVAANRIYHSQQVVPSMYEPEYRMQRSGSYMDLYSYPYTSYDPYRDVNNSRAVLVEYPEKEEYFLDRYREREIRRTGKRLRRSQSDVTLHSTRRPKNRKQRGDNPFDKSSKDSHDNHSRESRDSRDSYDKQNRKSHESRESRSNNHNATGKDKTTVAEVHRQRKPAPPPPMPKPKREEVYSGGMSEPALTESATDSAKLRAIEREREREKERERQRERDLQMEKDRKWKQEQSDKKKLDDYKSSFMRDNYGYISDSNVTGDLNVRPYNYEGKPVQQSSKYESSVVAKMAAMTETPRATYVRPGDNEFMSSNPQTFHEEVTKKLEKLKDTDVEIRPLDAADGPMATSTGKHSRSSRPTSAKERRRSRRASGVDQDGNVVTSEAFEFLDGYSDGEGTDFVGSGSISPVDARDYDVNL